MSPESDVRLEIEKLEQRFAENSKGRVFAHLADAYRKAGEFSKAEGLILHGLKNHPNYISAYIVLGRVYLDGQRFTDAHAQFSKVLELDPQNMIALKALGDLAVRGMEFEEARSWYERMLQVDPRSLEAQHGLEDLERKRLGISTDADAPHLADVEDDVAADETQELAEGPPEAAAPVTENEHSGPETEEPVAAEEAPLAWETAAEKGEPEMLSDAPPVELPWEIVEGPGETAPLGAAESEYGSSDDNAEMAAASWAQAGEGDRPVAEAPSPEPPQDIDFDLHGMEDWTPGLLGQGEVSTEGAIPPESVVEDHGDEAETGSAIGADERPPEVDQDSEDESDLGVVTETMAELFVGQGLLDDALRVYSQLAETRPDDESIQERIADLQQRIHGAEAEEHAPVWEDEAAVPAAQLEEGVVAAEGEAPPAELDTGFRFQREAPRDGLVDIDPFAGSFDQAQAGSTMESPEAETAPAEASASEFASPTDDLEALAAELEGADAAFEPPAEPEPVPSTLDPHPAAELGEPADDSAAVGFEEEDLATAADMAESDVADVELPAATEPQAEVPIDELGVPDGGFEAEPEPAASQFEPPAEEFEPPLEEFEPPTDEFVPPAGEFEPPVSEPEKSEYEVSGFQEEPVAEAPEPPLDAAEASSDLEALAAELEGAGWGSPEPVAEDGSGEPETAVPEPDEAAPEIDAPAAELDAILSDAGDPLEDIEPVGAALEYGDDAAKPPLEPEYEPPPELELSDEEPVAPAEEFEEAASEEPAPADAAPSFSTDALVADEDLWAPTAELPAEPPQIAGVVSSGEDAVESAEGRETIEAGQTIEGYLTGLLDFSPNVRPDSPSGHDAEDDVPFVEGSGRESSEDLARFQEWLRGLKR